MKTILLSSIPILMALLAGTIWGYRSSTDSLSRRVLKAIIPALCVYCLEYIAFKVFWSPLFFWNQVRVVASTAFSMGLKVYFSHESGGPGISGLNGPTFVIFYSLGGLLSRDPEVVIRIACLLSPLVFYGAPAWYFLREKNLLGIASLVLFLTFSILTPSIRMASLAIHADAPALGFAVLGAVCLMRDSLKLSHLVLSALCLSLALCSKIVVAPLLVALPIVLFLRGKRIQSFQLAGLCLLMITSLLGLYSLVFGSDLIFHNLVRPFSYGWKSWNQTDASAFGTAAMLKSAYFSTLLFFRKNFWLLGPTFIFVLFTLFRPTGETFWTKCKHFLNQPQSMLLVAGLSLLPSTILAFAKIGGAVNTFSPTLTFLLFFFTASFYALVQKKPQFTGAMVGLTAFLAVFVIPEFYSASYAGFATPRSEIREAAIAMKQHPGEYFFPEYPLVGLLEDRTLYHSWAYVQEHVGRPLEMSQSHFSAHIPQSFNKVALYRYPIDLGPSYLLEFNRELQIAQLPGWKIYTSNTPP